MATLTCCLVVPEACNDELEKAFAEVGFQIKSRETVEIGKEEILELLEVNDKKKPAPKEEPVSARGKKKPPAKGKQAEETKQEPSAEDYVAAFSGGPCEFFTLEAAADATEKLLTQVRPPKTEESPSVLYEALKASGKDVVVLCPSSPAASEEWIDLVAIFERERKELATALKKPTKKSPNVAIAEVMQFCFPPEIQHPRSTGRLIVFAMFGPFNEDGKLSGGIKGSRCVSAVELKCMIDEEEKTDILDVYVKGKGLPAEVKRDVLAAVEAGKYALPRMSKAQIKELLYDLPCPEPGKVSFHDLQRAVLKARTKRKEDMKQMYPNLTSLEEGQEPFIKPPPPKWGRPAPMKPDLEAQGLGTLGDNHFAVVSRMLHRESHSLVHLENANDSSQITQNVKLLRQDSKNHKWDSLSCLKGTNPGSYVGRTMKK